MKKQIILGLILIGGMILRGQETKQYFLFDIGWGENNLIYQLQNGIEKGKLSNSINASYGLFFSPNWGIQTGLGLQTFGSHSTLNYLSSNPSIDTDGDLYELRINFINWKEKQRALFLNIPVSIQYQHWVGNNFGLIDNHKLALIISMGIQFSIPIDANYKTFGGKIVTTGYFSQWNVELEDMPQHGFLTITNTYKGKLFLKPSYLGTFNLGWLYTLSKKTDLYLGTYLNYGLNNIIKADTKQIYQPDGVYNGIFASNQTNNIKLIAIGMKVGILLKLGTTKSSCKCNF
jgi:OmpA-OmpF porin, OOP family